MADSKTPSPLAAVWMAVAGVRVWLKGGAAIMTKETLRYAGLLVAAIGIAHNHSHKRVGAGTGRHMKF